ncbi:MAG: DUF5683 domain-containing protein [Leptospiraceae bacterium]|nr:DUF5683 domain-containing protein [Leptospiraceae bacterium]MDW8307623.1 DUF5683 domain-containing protein [Leptospiraceae bacterium]
MPHYGQEDFVEKTIQWKGRDGSGGYIFELRQSDGKTVYRETIQENRFTVRLSEGDYEFRVGVLNRFGKDPIFSNYIPLKVRLARLPVVEKEEKVVLPETAQSPILVKGRNFSRDIKVFLKKSDELIAPEKIIYKDKSELEIILPKDLLPGSYDLVLQNPKEKQQIIENYLRLPEVRPPVKGGRIAVLWRSAVLPGWGQIYAGRLTKGVALGTVFVAASAFYIYADLNFLREEKKYKNLRGDIYDPAFRESFLAQRQRYIRAEGTQNTAFGILFLVYLLNLVDAYFLNGPYEDQPSFFSTQPYSADGLFFTFKSNF